MNQNKGPFSLTPDSLRVLTPPSSNYTFKFLFGSAPACVNAGLTEIWVVRNLKVHSSASSVSKTPACSALSLHGLLALLFGSAMLHAARAWECGFRAAADSCPGLTSDDPLLGSEFAGCWKMMEAMEVSLVKAVDPLGITMCQSLLCPSVHL